MITITTKEIYDFINNQPPKRKINFKQSFSWDSCGCLMVHYGKEVLKIHQEFSCGEYAIGDDCHLKQQLSTMLCAKYDTLYRINTYGKLQQHIRSNLSNTN